jgi:solute carrier family 25, member 38
VPGVALYYTSLQQVRYTFGSIFPWAVASTKQGKNKSGKVTTLPVLSHGGNMAAGALTRTAIGLILNPLTIVKARFEVNDQFLLNPGQCSKYGLLLFLDEEGCG